MLLFTHCNLRLSRYFLFSLCFSLISRDITAGLWRRRYLVHIDSYFQWVRHRWNRYLSLICWPHRLNWYRVCISIFLWTGRNPLYRWTLPWGHDHFFLLLIGSLLAFANLLCFRNPCLTSSGNHFCCIIRVSHLCGLLFFVCLRELWWSREFRYLGFFELIWTSCCGMRGLVWGITKIASTRLSSSCILPIF